MNNKLKFPKYLTTLTGLFCFFFILPTILLKKTILIPYLGLLPISIFFTGIYFVLLDIITEVYGYFEARKALYSALLVYTLFVFIMEFVVNINQYLSNTSNINNNAYLLIFSNTYVTWISVVLCALIFDIFNIRLMSKLKFLLKSKYFIVRSLISSSSAIIMFSIVTNFFAFYKQILSSGFIFYLELNTVSILVKITTLTIFSIPSWLIINFLKKSEHIDIIQDINLFLFNKKENI